MITRNMKRLSAVMLQSSSTVFGHVGVRNVSGVSYYIHGAFSFPNSRAEAFTATATAAGISFGTDGTAATELDENLKATITSGINVTLTSKTLGCDAPGNPWIKYTFTVTNTSDDTLTIREVGYKQSIKCSTTPGRNDSVDAICLLDRTVLDDPLTLASSDAGVLVYKLRTNPEPTKTKNGVTLVSFEWSSDEQIAAMIDAAQAGTIDLQEDAGWRVGDMRKINISAFTAGGSVSQPAQAIDIVITSFEDYNSCGAVLQFDFFEELSAGVRMNPTNTTAGGWDACEMRTVTMPALVEALPEWIQTRLKTFSVYSSGELVGNNKLALRSVTEIFGTGSGEGAQMAFYNGKNRVKRRGWSGSGDSWWERSVSSGSDFCSVANYGGSNYYNASSARGVAPFGCL